MVAFLSCTTAQKDRVLMIKEYFRTGTTEDFHLTEIHDTTKSRIPCPYLGTIWTYDKGKFFTSSEKAIYILSQECQRLDSLVFQQNVLDFAIRANVLFASTSDDEVEYTRSRLYLVNIDTKQIQLLEMPEEGAKFGLALSEDLGSLAFIREDVFNSTQTLTRYDLRTKATTAIHEVVLTSDLLGMINYPSRVRWAGSSLYYAVVPFKFGPWKLMQFDTEKDIKQTVMALDSKYSCVFRITKDQDSIVLLKRGKVRFESVVSINLKTKSEKVVYACTEFTLSDLDDFVYQD